MKEVDALARGDGFRQNSWKAFVFVFQFLLPHKRRMILVCLSDISIVLLNLAIPWFAKTLVDQAFPQRDWALATKIVGIVAAILLVVHGLVALRTFLYNTTEQLLQLDLRNKMYSHLQKLSLDTIEAIPFGEHQFRVTTDSDRIAHMLVRILPTLTMLVEFAIILSAAIYVDPILTGVVLLFLLPWTLLFIWVTHYGRVLDRRRLRFCEMRDAAILQAASSFATIKSAGRVKWELSRTGKISIALQRISAQGYLILVGFEFATQRLIPYAKTITIYLYLARQVVQGQMTLGTTLPMIAYLGRLTYPIERIVNFGCWIWQTMVSAERMMQILQTEPAIIDVPGAVSLARVRGDIELRDVCYERSNVGQVLSGVNLSLEPGKLVAVVGPSGAGKSTIVNLVLRLIEPSSGVVLVDGQKLSEIQRESYLGQVATVVQDTYIFNGSIADNLRVAKPRATEDEMNDALQSVGLLDWSQEFPTGIHTDLANGQALSAGQKQRMGIARALLTQAPVLILDEPTSALDPQTEREIMAILLSIAANRATLLVTHRLETVRTAHEIVVLKQGQIVERGSHPQLLNEAGLYAELLATYRSRNTDVGYAGMGAKSS